MYSQCFLKILANQANCPIHQKTTFIFSLKFASQSNLQKINEFPNRSMFVHIINIQYILVIHIIEFQNLILEFHPKDSQIIQ